MIPILLRKSSSKYRHEHLRRLTTSGIFALGVFLNTFTFGTKGFPTSEGRISISYDENAPIDSEYSFSCERRKDFLQYQNCQRMRLPYGTSFNNSNIPPCHFTTGDHFDHQLKFIKLLQVTQRFSPLLLQTQEKCTNVFQFPELDQASQCGLANMKLGGRKPQLGFGYDEDDFKVSPRMFLKWSRSGLALVPYQMGLEEGTFYFPTDEYILILLKITKTSGFCMLQVQQYSNCNYERALMDDRGSVCGVFPCTEEKQLMKQMHQDRMSKEGILGARREFQTFSYYLKGLILPALISASAALGYTIWRKRMKLSRRALGYPIRIPFPEGPEEPNFQQDEDFITIEEGKPPSYESLLEPPSYEDAIAKEQTTPTITKELDAEVQQLLTSMMANKEPQEETDDEQLMLLLPPPPDFEDRPST